MTLDSSISLLGCFVNDPPGNQHVDSKLVRFRIDQSLFEARQENQIQGEIDHVPVSDKNEFEPMAGKTIDRYRLDRQIGSGGFASVWRAQHQILNTFVAIKFITDERTDAKALCAEARLVASIKHPNIVTVIDANVLDKCAYIVMEYIDGMTLQRMIQERRSIPYDEAFRIAKGVCAGLKAAASNSIIHRDIKPANVLIDRSGAVKVVDFGLAGQELSQDANTGAVIVGTPSYMAPEQAINANLIDFRADIYALGCTLYHMITGNLPYVGGNPVEVITAHHYSAIPRVDDRHSVPVAAADLVKYMMAKDPADRPSSYDEVISLLDRSLHPHPQTPSSKGTSFFRLLTGRP